MDDLILFLIFVSVEKYFLFLNSAIVHDISSQPLQQEKWWYHRVHWHDMNNDGLKDALSARAYLDAGKKAH